MLRITEDLSGYLLFCSTFICPLWVTATDFPCMFLIYVVWVGLLPSWLHGMITWNQSCQAITYSWAFCWVLSVYRTTVYTWLRLYNYVWVASLFSAPIREKYALFIRAVTYEDTIVATVVPLGESPDSAWNRPTVSEGRVGTGDGSDDVFDIRIMEWSMEPQVQH